MSLLHCVKIDRDKEERNDLKEVPFNFLTLFMLLFSVSIHAQELRYGEDIEKNILNGTSTYSFIGESAPAYRLYSDAKLEHPIDCDLGTRSIIKVVKIRDYPNQIYLLWNSQIFSLEKRLFDKLFPDGIFQVIQEKEISAADLGEIFKSISEIDFDLAVESTHNSFVEINDQLKALLLIKDQKSRDHETLDPEAVKYIDSLTVQFDQLKLKVMSMDSVITNYGKLYELDSENEQDDSFISIPPEVTILNKDPEKIFEIYPEKIPDAIPVFNQVLGEAQPLDIPNFSIAFRIESNTGKIRFNSRCNLKPMYWMLIPSERIKPYANASPLILHTKYEN